MKELIETYSISEILIILVLLASSVKGVITFLDWAKSRIQQSFDTEIEKETEMDEIRKRLDKGSEDMKEITSHINELTEQMKVIIESQELLINSNKDSIKSFLTKEHHYYCYQVGWIDDYSLDCCERQYSHYKHEGGNSFIAGLMEDLRALPNVPPEELKKFDNTKEKMV